jgi:hypothetical protein
MITLEYYIALCSLTDAQVLAIAEPEHGMSRIFRQVGKSLILRSELIATGSRPEKQVRHRTALSRPPGGVPSALRKAPRRAGLSNREACSVSAQ